MIKYEPFPLSATREEPRQFLSSNSLAYYGTTRGEFV